MAIRILDDRLLSLHLENISVAGGLSEISSSESQSEESCKDTHTSCVAGGLSELSSSESQSEKSCKDLTVESNDHDICQEQFLDHNAFEKHENFKKFIPVSSLTVENLPPAYRHTEMLDLINAMSVVVVKISFIDKNGKSVLGSGIVDDVMISSDDDCVCPCLCEVCSASSDREWGAFSVVTAARLALGSHENISSFLCTLFFETDDQFAIQQLHGHKLVTYNEMKDLLIFSCVTENVSLLRKLKAGLDTFSDNWERSYFKYFQTVKWEAEKIVFSVSHPYGLRKHLSIGHQLSRKDDGDDEHRTCYDLALCLGCVGAYVLVPDFNVVQDFF